MDACSDAQEALFDLEEPEMPRPGCCEFEAVTVALGSQLKSRCLFRGRPVYTNCREVGHCVWDGWYQRCTCDSVVRLDEGGEDG